MHALSALAIASLLLALGRANLSIDDAADHVINATESIAVAFTVPKLDSNATGTVTFTNTGNHHVMVNVDANGDHSADLSTLTSGMIMSSRSATRVDTSATGNKVSLDTDSGLYPTLSINAADPADVKFTVAELEGDEHGTVTFIDSSARQDVVKIGSNGTYSVNPSNLINGSLTYLIRVTDSAGDVRNVDPTVTLGRTGSAGAPAGMPQLPTLLNAYAVRPSWDVAGVDYAVGMTSGTGLKDPSTISMAGVSVDAVAHVINIVGNNVTLSGYDYSLDGGWAVVVNSGDNVSIQNSKFVVGSNFKAPFVYVSPNASNATIKNNTMDGSGSTLGSSGSNAQMLIAVNGTGTTTIEYNLIQNAWGQNIVMGSDVGGENWVVQYNVIENAGEGFNSGAHGDWIQTYNAPGKNTNSFECNFNTFVQNIPIAEGRTQGISAFSANSGSNSGGVQTESFNNNTFVATSGAYVNYGIIVDTTRLIGTATIESNYFDTSGIGSANGGGGNWSFVGNYNPGKGGSNKGTVAASNNVNMVSGSYYGQKVRR